MKLNRELEKKVEFAKFCIRDGLSPLDAAELVVLARRASLASVRYANNQDEIYKEQEGKYRKAFEEKATALGYTICWAWAAPDMYKDGVRVFLPY